MLSAHTLKSYLVTFSFLCLPIVLFFFFEKDLFAQQCAPNECNRAGEYICQGGTMCCSNSGCPTWACVVGGYTLTSDNRCYRRVSERECLEQMRANPSGYPEGFDCQEYWTAVRTSGNTCRYCEGTAPPPPRPACYNHRTCVEYEVCRNVYDSGLGRYRKECEMEQDCWVSRSECLNSSNCTPAACPAGTSESGKGPLMATRTCSYILKGSNCVEYRGERVCQNSQKIRYCYGTFTDPPLVDDDDIVIDDSATTTTALGCFAERLSGREVNNSLNLEMDITDPNGASDVRAFLVWFGTGPNTPSINQIASGTGLLRNNHSFGFMVGNYNGNWRVFIPRYNASNNTWSWINANSIGTGERARIKGETGKDFGIIRDIVVSNASTNVKRMTAKLELLHDASGVTNFESAISGNYTVYAAASDASRFYQGTGTTMGQIPTYSAVQSWTVDLEAPVRENISHEVVNADRLNLVWSFEDTSGIKRVIGDAEASGEEGQNGPIDDITSGVLNYQLGSGSAGSNMYGGNHLWVANANSRSDLIDIRDNEGGAIDFIVTAFDNACNSAEYTYNMELGEPWLITKGGVVFSANGTAMSIKQFADHTRFSEDSYWAGDFGFYKDESDLSTELLSGGGSTLNALVNSVKLSSVRAVGYNDRNNKSDYWFDELSRKYSSMFAADSTRYTDINIIDDSTTFDGSSSQIVDPTLSSKRCNTSTSCVVKVTGNLNIESGFSCNTRTTFLVDGNVNIDPDMTAANKRSGCMFVASGNITLDAGTHKSEGSTYPRYDIVEGLFMADGQILMPEVDRGEDVRDGLKVNGSLIAFGGAGNKSISMGRTLKLIDNNAYPSVAIHFDNRYLNFATTVFGGQTETFKREVGFKPL